MRKVLVTGGCGFVGFRLVSELINRGYEVDVVDNFYIGKEAKEVTRIGANFLHGDVRGMTNIKDKPYDYVFHLASISRIQTSFPNPGLTYDVNLTGTKEVVEYCHRNGCKLIFAGSSSIHQNPELSPYSMSKHLAESWIKMYKKVFDLNAEIVRFYNVYGPNELMEDGVGAVIGLFRNKINKGQQITIHGDGEQKRDFTHIDDIVDGLIKVAESEKKHEDAWELGTGVEYSINDIAKFFFEKYGTLDVKYVPNVKGNYKHSLRKNDDALKELGWEPKDRLEEYIMNL